MMDEKKRRERKNRILEGKVIALNLNRVREFVCFL